MRANERICVFWHAFFNTRLSEKCACVLRVRRLLISDLYCKLRKFGDKSRNSLATKKFFSFSGPCRRILTTKLTNHSSHTNIEIIIIMIITEHGGHVLCCKCTYLCLVADIDFLTLLLCMNIF